MQAALLWVAERGLQLCPIQVEGRRHRAVMEALVKNRLCARGPERGRLGRRVGDNEHMQVESGQGLATAVE